MIRFHLASLLHRFADHLDPIPAQSRRLRLLRIARLAQIIEGHGIQDQRDLHRIERLARELAAEDGTPDRRAAARAGEGTSQKTMSGTNHERRNA